MPGIMCVAILAMAATPAPRVTPLSPADFLRACDVQAEYVCRVFTDEAIWEGDQTVLLAHLRVVSALRPKQLIPVMVKHVAHINKRHPYLTRPMPIEDSINPVVAVIRSYGQEAIPELIAQLKEHDYDTLDLPGRLRYSTAVHSLCLIGGKRTGAGKLYARMRIEQEIETAGAQDKAKLTKLLQHPHLRLSHK